VAATADILAPGFAATPYWWEAAAPAGEGSTPPPDATDVAIVGSGYAGLHAALALARAGTRVAVLEADAIGAGASSRNGGMVSGGVNVGKGVDLERRLGARRVRELLEDAAASLDHLEQTIAREGIECHYARSGRFVPAHCGAAYRRLARRVDFLNDACRADARMLPRARQREELASDWYQGGMVLERAGGLHPALYHRGLRRLCESAGVTLCGDARVTGIAGAAGALEVRTARGAVRAREAIVATNGYTGEATPWHRRRVVPVASHIIATEEIGAERVRGIFPNLRMIADTKKVLYYFRPSPDGRRVVFGGRASFRAIDARETARRLHEFMCGVLPQLRGVRVTHCWTGNVAMTFDALPHMGERGGVHYCLGCNGSGVAMMGWLGHHTALKILGRTNRPCAFDGLPFPTRPLYDAIRAALPMALLWYHARDRLDRMIA